jgi:hypothetical protein
MPYQSGKILSFGLRTRLGVVLAITCAAGVLAGCAAAPRSDNTALANSGLVATSAFAGDISDLSRRLAQGDVQNAFSTTWAVCTTTQFCEPKWPSDELSQARGRLSKTIAARTRAISALNEAYGALAAEAAYDARSDASAATQAAFDASGVYAGIAGVGTLPVMLGPIASYGAGLWADRAQARRLQADNVKLANAATLLAAGLAKEKADFDRIAREVIEQEIEAESSLVDSGLVSAGQSLQSLAASVGTTLVKDPDAVLAKSTPAKVATVAAINAAANARFAVLQSRYAASLAALDELKRQHTEAARDQPLNLAVLNQRIAELDALLVQVRAK